MANGDHDAAAVALTGCTGRDAGGGVRHFDGRGSCEQKLNQEIILEMQRRHVRLCDCMRLAPPWIQNGVLS